MTNLTKLAILLAIMLPLAALQGWAIQTMWGWFVMSIFDAPKLPLVNAIGLALMVSFFTVSFKKNEHENFVEGLIFIFMKPLLFLGFGLIYITVFG